MAFDNCLRIQVFIDGILLWIAVKNATCIPHQFILACFRTSMSFVSQIIRSEESTSQRSFVEGLVSRCAVC